MNLFLERGGFVRTIYYAFHGPSVSDMSGIACRLLNHPQVLLEMVLVRKESDNDFPANRAAGVYWITSANIIKNSPCVDGRR